MPKSNRQIDHLIMTANWHIDFEWGMQQLHGYLAELAFLESGGTIDYAERRKKPLTTVIKTELEPIDGTSESRKTMRIAQHRLEGVMKMDDKLSSPGIRSLVNSMRMADDNPEIDAHILDINSGGGDATAGQLMMTTVADMKKPIYSYIHIAGSAAYMAALPSDKIFLAGPQSRAGSIGSLITIDKQVVNDFKENYEAIYSDESPDKNKAFRKYLEGDLKPIKSIVNEAAKTFQNSVLSYRNLPEETRKNTLQGNMFIAKEAVKRGLADGIKTFNQVSNSIGNHILQNFNNNLLIAENSETMKFNDFMAKAFTLLNSIFGWQTTAETDADAVLAKLSEVQPVSEQISNALTENLGTLNARIEELVTSLDEMTQKVSNLETELGELRTEKEGWLKEKAALELQVAKLEAKPTLDGNNDFPADSTAANFNGQLRALQLEGDSKY